MDDNRIKELLEGAIISLSEHHPTLFEFTSATHQTEWNIAHHYANEVSALFSDYDCDVDISKPNLNNKRPDIVVHRRGTHESNFLVIEVKRDRNDVPEDLQKIRDCWFHEPLRYEYGAVVMIDGYENTSVTLIKSIGIGVRPHTN